MNAVYEIKIYSLVMRAMRAMRAMGSMGWGSGPAEELTPTKKQGLDRWTTPPSHPE